MKKIVFGTVAVILLAVIAVPVVRQFKSRPQPSRQPLQAWAEGETRFKKDWHDRGCATPTAALETVLWEMAQGRRDNVNQAYSAQMASVVSVTLQQVFPRPQANELELRLQVRREGGSVVNQSMIIREGDMQWNCAGGIGPANAIRF